MHYDLLIRGGTVVDGTRVPRFRADVGIKDGKIRRIGRIEDAEAGRVLDATGCIVAPGFIDIHTHYDAQLFWDPYCTISGWHGVTSVAISNCGFGFVPVKPTTEAREQAMRSLERVEQIPYAAMKAALDWDWETFPEWLDRLQRTPKGVNVMAFVPVSPLMIYVMGSREAAKSRPATAAEQKEMQRLLSEAMEAGAAGFSIERTGQKSAQTDCDGTPFPAALMCDEDLLALAEVLGECGTGFIQIVQAYEGDPIRKTEEERDRDRAFLERLAEVAQRPILYFIIMVIDDLPTFHTNELDWVHDANNRGLQIYAQGLSVRAWAHVSLETWTAYDSAPTWNQVTQGTIAEKIEKMSDPVLRQKMRDEYEMLSGGRATMPESLTVLKTPDHPELETYIGRKVAELATEKGCHPNDMMLDIAIAGDLKVIFRSMNLISDDADKVASVMSDTRVIPGVSDGGAHTKSATGGSFTTDFLTWLVRDTGKLTLEDAHHQLSYLPARMAGLVDRGSLTEGAFADVVVYDLANLKRVPESDYETAYDLPGNEWRVIQRAEGYRWTIVNGVITFEDGKCSEATPGQLLRNGAADTT